MRPISSQDLWPLPAYERHRPEVLERLIAYKRPRRVSLGDAVTVVFESRETVLFQIQETLRAEGIEEPRRVEREIATYAPLLPGEGELSATALVHAPMALGEPLVRALAEDAACLRLTVDDVQVPAMPAETDASLGAVVYLRFPLAGVPLAPPATLELDTSRYRARAMLGDETLAALRQNA